MRYVNLWNGRSLIVILRRFEKSWLKWKCFGKRAYNTRKNNSGRN